jgi:C_GCAxxG_C_C family probable redox protein
VPSADEKAAKPAARTALPGFSSARATHAAEEALELYGDGLFCGETLLKVINELAPSPLPASVVRLGSGFCAGIGDAGCACGALAGGVMAIGLLAGRESADDDWEPSYYASREFHDWFVAEFSSACCRNIVRQFGGMDGAGRHEHCAVVVGTTAGWVVELAERCGWL